MKKKSILRMLLMLCPAMASYASEGTPDSKGDKTKKSPADITIIKDGEEAKAIGECIKSNRDDFVKGMIIGTVGGTANLVFAYARDASFRSHIDGFSEETKNTVLRNIVAPIYKKAYTIKDHGITFKDVGKVFLGITALYGIKKIHDYFGVWHAWRTGDWSQTQKKCAIVNDFVRRHALEFSLMGASALTTAFLWYRHYTKEEPHRTPRDKFFYSFTPEQRAAVPSAEWKSMVQHVHHNPLNVQSLPKIRDTLTEEQHELLAKVVEEYLEENPHVGFED